MILGKFYPPHKGHQHLIEYARERVDSLTIIVGSLCREAIPGELRCRWLKELYDDVEILHLTDENPQEPHEHPDFWNIWTASLRRIYSSGPDYLFSSETYGDRLARCLGAEHVLVDLSRITVPVSGTAVRERPYENWEFLPPPVKAYYVKRVVIVGAESTGKTTLAEKLAARFNTLWVPEFARGYIDDHYGSLGGIKDDDFSVFAFGQVASEDRMAREANRILICDTDARTTSYFSDIFTGRCDSSILRLAEERKYHLYLLTGNDFPWVEDSQRIDEKLREAFFQRWVKDLERMKANYVILNGSFEERFHKAESAINALFR